METQIINFFSILNSIIHPEEKKIELNKPIDWDFLIETASLHNLLALFVESASSFEEFDEVKDKSYIRKTTLIVMQQMQKSSAFLDLYKAFMDKNIFPLVMKGIVCRHTYGKYADHRPSGDEDILIRLSDYDNAKKILLSQGYTTEFTVTSESQLKTVQEITFYNPVSKLIIELHLNPIGCENEFRVKMNNYFKNVFDNAIELNINNIPVRTFSHTDHFLYLILHAFKHFTAGGFGFRQMLDILIYYENYKSELDFDYLKNAFEDLNVQLFVTDLICIGNKYIGFDLDLFSSENCPDELLKDMLKCGVFGSGTQVQVTATQFTNAAMEKGNTQENKISKIIHTAFPDKSYMQTFCPEINEKPWLIIPEWVKRWHRYIKRNKEYDGNLMSESMKLSEERVSLMKKYNVFKNYP